MAYETRIAIRNNFAIDNTKFFDLVGPAYIPIACSLIIVYNNSAQDVTMRTDPNNSASEVNIPAGEAFDIGVSSRSGPPLFGPGDLNPAATFKSASSGINLTIECIL